MKDDDDKSGGMDIINTLLKIGDDRWRRVDDCNKTTSEFDKRQDKLEKSFTASNTKLNVVIAILSFIATAFAPVCIKILFGG